MCVRVATGILVRIEDVLSGSARLTWVEEELSIRPTRGDVSLALDSKVDRTEMSAELANKAGSLWVEARLRDRIAETGWQRVCDERRGC